MPVPGPQSLSMRMGLQGVGGWNPLSSAGLAGEVLEDALVRVVVTVVVVGQDARIVGALHVPAQCLTGALQGCQRQWGSCLSPLIPHFQPGSAARGHQAPWLLGVTSLPHRAVHDPSTWSLSSSSPSVAMLPEGFFRGGLERRRTRLTLSRITWGQKGVSLGAPTGRWHPVGATQSAWACLMLTAGPGTWGDAGYSISACIPLRDAGGPILPPPPAGTSPVWELYVDSPLGWLYMALLPRESRPCLAPCSLEDSEHLINVVQDLQDGKDASADEQAHLPPDVPWRGRERTGHQQLLHSPSKAIGAEARQQC